MADAAPAPSAAGRGTSAYDYWAVLDFEATCDEPKQMRPQEIIEFPIVLVEAATQRTVSTFHLYVTPRVNPQLTPFCTQLTGIQQQQVDSGLDLSVVLTLVGRWLRHHNLSRRPDGGASSFIICTCGDWDMRHLATELRSRGESVPEWARDWCNVKEVYSSVQGCRAPGMAGMLQNCGLTLDGHHHSGIDDARNIAKLLCHLVRQGGAVTATAGHLSSPPPFRAEAPSAPEPRDCTTANVGDWLPPGVPAARGGARHADPAAGAASGDGPVAPGLPSLRELLVAGTAGEEAERAAKARTERGRRGDLARVARETLDILQKGSYEHPDTGETVHIAEATARAVASSVIYPEETWRPAPSDPAAGSEDCAVEVRCCTVLSAAQELAVAAGGGGPHPGVLNFASARNPGGGFSTGAEAQEESIARSSALYPCLSRYMREFFVPNRRAPSGVYRHCVIYSPAVPVWRDEHGRLLPRPYLCDFATAAAPNTNVCRRDLGPEQGTAAAQSALTERIGRVLDVFGRHGARDIVLGAWGCGVFGGDPRFVAGAFAAALGGAFRGRFRRVLFAVKDPNMAAIFAHRFGCPSPPGCPDAAAAAATAEARAQRAVKGGGKGGGGRKGGHTDKDGMGGKGGKRSKGGQGRRHQ